MDTRPPGERLPYSTSAIPAPPMVPGRKGTRMAAEYRSTSRRSKGRAGVHHRDHPGIDGGHPAQKLHLVGRDDDLSPAGGFPGLKGVLAQGQHHRVRPAGGLHRLAEKFLPVLRLPEDLLHAEPQDSGVLQHLAALEKFRIFSQSALRHPLPQGHRVRPVLEDSPGAAGVPAVHVGAYEGGLLLRV